MYNRFGCRLQLCSLLFVYCSDRFRFRSIPIPIDSDSDRFHRCLVTRPKFETSYVGGAVVAQTKCRNQPFSFFVFFSCFSIVLRKVRVRVRRSQIFQDTHQKLNQPGVLKKRIYVVFVNPLTGEDEKGIDAGGLVSSPPVFHRLFIDSLSCLQYID